jgi:hypothetical protein
MRLSLLIKEKQNPLNNFNAPFKTFSTGSQRRGKHLQMQLKGRI